MFKQTIRLTIFFLATFSLNGCATRSRVYSDYQEATREGPRSPHTASRTVLVFLVDGLSVRNLKQAFESRKGEHIRDFFLGEKNSFYLGRAVFPTLTYPNISSILTCRNIDEQPIIGNEEILAGRQYNFTSPFDTGELNGLLRPYSVFSKLAGQNRSSVSLAAYFGDGATAHYPEFDLRAGAAYSRGDFAYVDDKLIDSLDRLLTRTDVDLWPEFIFVHIVGVDGLSHKYGPQSKLVSDYINRIDGRLTKIFDLLREAEANGKNVVSILTADHGFVSTPKFLELEPALKKLNQELKVLNQDRLFSLYFPKTWSTEKRRAALASIQRIYGVGATVFHSNNQLEISVDGRSHFIRYRSGNCQNNYQNNDQNNYQESYQISFDGGRFYCNNELEAGDSRAASFYYPYFASAVASYFHSPYHPDAIVLATQGVTFARGNLGDHGGPTPDETLVPVLIRNAQLNSTTPTMPTYKLLNFVADIAPPSPAYAPTKSEVRELTGNLLEITVPFRSWNIQADALGTKNSFGLTSATSPGLGFEYHQYWSRLLSTSMDFDFDFSGLQTTGSITSPELQLTNGLGISGWYHFGDSTKLIARVGARERYFALIDSTNGNNKWDKYWIPEFGFKTQTKLISLGIGDIWFLGGLNILAGRNSDNLFITPGLSQDLGFFFARNTGVADVMGARLNLEHLTQNSTFLGSETSSGIKSGLGSGTAQAETRVTVALYYGVSFL